MSNLTGKRMAKVVVAVVVAAILAACASTPKAPPGSAAVRTKLTVLKSQTQLAAQVPAVLQQAEKAVILAETPQRNAEVASHRVYLADKLVDTARATAETRLAETQRAALKQQSEESRLAARTREADAAQRTASVARADAEASRARADNARNESERARIEAESIRSQTDAVRIATEAARVAEEQRATQKQLSDDARQAARGLEVDAALRAAATARSDAETSRVNAEDRRLEADRARNESESARNQAAVLRNEADAARNATEAARLVSQAATDAAANAEAQKQELARQIVLLQGRTTERGIVLTLGDVLFASGSDQLKPGAVGNLDRLVAFMGMYADRSATIEGHTDSVGDERNNEALSQRRADSVKAYLSRKGVAAARLTSIGKGEIYPVSGNESAGGRQQNRRVEVIIGSGMTPVVLVH